ncbi:MAG: glycolate oxidase subunit GlcF [Pseudorhodoplanes sp.]
MQTSFSLTQLADPDTAESAKILRACVHCGFCTATCPTYVLLGDERDSPRGRIAMIKDMLESGGPASPDVVRHVDRCLSCLSCMTTCPSGVHYMHLVDHGRARIAETYRRPWTDRLLRALLSRVVPDPRLFSLALFFGVLAKPLAPLLTAAGLKRLAAMLRLSRFPRRPRSAGRRVFAAEGRRRARVAMLSGCANQVLTPSTNAAAIRLLTRHGVEVVLAANETCCGSLVHHMGLKDQAHASARRNIDAWLHEAETEGLDAVVVTASGCGTTVKDYGFMLREDDAYAGKAARISGLTRDIMEFLPGLDVVPAQAPRDLSIAYHAACSLQHGQRIVRQPKELLSKMGFVVKDVPEQHLCCGSAGTYNILQPDIAKSLRDRKIANIESLGVDAVAAGNVGCIAQIASGTEIPVLHPVELIDWATGGPEPEGFDKRRIRRSQAH